MDDSMWCIMSNAWSNIKNEPVVNYMAVVRAVTLFLEAISTGEQSYDAKWIASNLKRAMEKFDNCIGGVTDNTAANKSA